jgi:hypothetical protein
MPKRMSENPESSHWCGTLESVHDLDFVMNTQGLLAFGEQGIGLGPWRYYCKLLLFKF